MWSPSARAITSVQQVAWKELLASSPGIREAYRISTIRQQLDIESVKILDEIVRDIDEVYGLYGIHETQSTYPYKK